MTQENKPIDTIRDGALSATIWKNIGEGRPFYSVRLKRGYQDESGDWHDSDSFSGHELLRVAYLATAAHERILVFRNDERTAA